LGLIVVSQTELLSTKTNPYFVWNNNQEQQMEWIYPVASLAKEVIGLFQRRPPEHLSNANHALTLQHEKAMEEFKKLLNESRTEAEKLRAQNAIDAEKKASARAPVTDEALIEAARRKFGLNCINDFNAIITGDSGAGKSTFIAFMIGLRVGQPGAPKVGVRETTVQMAAYTSPTNPQVKLWDAPGCGTTRFPFYNLDDPDLHYYPRFVVFAFNLVIIFFSGRLLQGSAELARTCLAAGQPVIIVRNKADVDVQDLLTDNPSMNEADARARAAMEFHNNLRSAMTRIPHFLISARMLQSGQRVFDEQALFDFFTDAVRSRTV
jgi:Interferon-inducible GTPase (IIGP)